MKSSTADTMKLTQYFDISRFWLLLKLELYRSQKAVLMTLVIAFGLHFFIDLLLSPILEPSRVVYEHNSNYAFSLILGGLILSSLAFHDLSNTLRRHRYLTLPASNLEKFGSMWLLTTLGWAIGFTIIYTLYTVGANFIGPFLLGYMDFQPFNPLGEFPLTAMRYYLVTQGIFLVGATHFKGYVFPKTLFTLILFAAVCGFIAYLITSGSFPADDKEDLGTEYLEGTMVDQMWEGLQWMFWWVLAPACWVITYLGLKEKEV